MRFMMLLKADKITEAGVLPTRKDLEVMGKYNEELVKSGVLLDGAGLHPSSKGARVTFPAGKPQVTDGPFAEAKEFLAGYWIVDVESPERVYELAARVSAAPGIAGAPLNMPIEVREVMSAPPVEV